MYKFHYMFMGIMGHFQDLTIMSCAAINIDMHVLLWHGVINAFKKIPIAGSSRISSFR